MKLFLLTVFCFFSSLQLQVTGQLVNNTYPSSSLNLIGLGNLPNKYLFSDFNATFYDASNFCFMYGMDLVKLEERTEYDYIYAHINVLAGTYYLISAHTLARDQWLWIDGTQLTFTAWGEGSPNQPSIQRCLIIQKGHGWNDRECEVPFYFICETR